MKIILLMAMFLVFSVTSWASYQISCPSKGIVALNQTNQYTTQTIVNGVATNQVVNYDVPYFNNLFNATDCTINQISDPTPAAQKAIQATQMAQEQQTAQIEAQIQANRNAYIDALIAGDTATQKSIATAQAALISQKAAVAN